MSKIVDFLYGKAPKVEMPGFWKLAYILCGVIAAASLLSAYYSTRQALHQILTTAAIAGMLVIRGICAIRATDRKQYLITGFPRDLGIFLIWLMLLAVWIVDPQI